MLRKQSHLSRTNTKVIYDVMSFLIEGKIASLIYAKCLGFPTLYELREIFIHSVSSLFIPLYRIFIVVCQIKCFTTFGAIWYIMNYKIVILKCSIKNLAIKL